MSVVGQDRRPTPVPTLNRQSLSTLAHHCSVSAFPGWVRQFVYTRRRGGTHAGRGATKQNGRKEGEPGRP